jgi:hypothetical protein
LKVCSIERAELSVDSTSLIQKFWFLFHRISSEAENSRRSTYIFSYILLEFESTSLYYGTVFIESMSC